MMGAALAREHLDILLKGLDQLPLADFIHGGNDSIALEVRDLDKAWIEACLRNRGRTGILFEQHFFEV